MQIENNQQQKQETIEEEQVEEVPFPVVECIGHDWETLSNSPFEWDGDEPMFLYHCLNCEDTKVDL